MNQPLDTLNIRDFLTIEAKNNHQKMVKLFAAENILWEMDRLFAAKVWG